MKKITLLVIAILLVTVVFATEDPVRIIAKKTASYSIQDCKVMCGCDVAPLLCPGESTPANDNPRCVNGIYNTVSRCYFQCLFEPECFNTHPSNEGPKSVNSYCEKNGNPGKCVLEEPVIAPSLGFMKCDTSGDDISIEEVCNDINAQRNLNLYETCPLPDYCGGQINEEEVVLDCDPECRPDGTKIVPGETVGQCELNNIKVSTLQEVRQYLCYMTPDPENPETCDGTYGGRIANYFNCLRGVTIHEHNIDEESLESNVFTPEEQRLPIKEELCKKLEQCVTQEGINFNWVENELTVPCVYQENCGEEVELVQENQDNNGGRNIPCPYLYSITKDGKVFEETLLEAQFSSKMNRPYYSKLDNYDPAIARIQIREPFFETAYIDTIKLYRVNEDALVGSNGKFYSVKEPQPVLCKTKSGEDCTLLISKEDASYYSPFKNLDSRVIKPSNYGVKAYLTKMNGINSESTSYDYLELTLPKAGKGKLIVSYSLNPKLSKFEPKLVSDIKDILPFVYSSLENSKIAAKVDNKLKQVGFAKVLEYDNGWKYTGEQFISYTQKEAIIPFDIKTNKVRIEFLSGMYIIDYVAVDYSVSEIIVEEIPKKSDIREINKQDNSYIILSQGEFLEVEFEESEPGTFILETRGYYQPGTDKNIELKTKFNYEEFKLLFNILLKKDFAEKYVSSLIQG